MNASDVHVLGIRHHGPGSARTVERALEELLPRRILIEGPPELDAIVPYAASDRLIPPVAALVYDVAQPRRAAFYPFAAFSPEWVALRWALSRGVAVGFADLAAARSLSDGERPDAGAAEPHEGTSPEIGEADDPEDTRGSDDPEDPRGSGDRLRDDPIAALAAAAGVSDPERWWEDAVEHRGALGGSAFADIAAAMAAVRETRTADEGTLRREAAMRLAIRRASADGERLVVVCGAYHAPALDPATFPSQRADAALVGPRSTARVAATWAPWTSERLALASGYGAGVASPGWYAHLFGETGDPVASWMVKAARALREEDLAASPAAAVESTRVAHALAALRGRPSAGLDEVRDAVLGVLCEGADAPLALVEHRLTVGAELGEVPDDVPAVPLAEDLARQQRALRLKPSAGVTALELDLRRENQLARSVLLHRLTLLDVPWGTRTDARTSTGTFAEGWKLEWRPELAVALVVASLHGTTIADAAAAALTDRADASDDLGELAGLVETALLADVPDGLDAVIRRISDRAAHRQDVVGMLRTIEPLARVRRYGTVRGADTAVVERLLETTLARVSVGLRPAAASLDDDAAGAYRAAIEGAERGIRLIGLPDAAWLAGLHAVGRDDRVHGLVAGRAVRMLLDRGEVERADAASALGRRLSAAGRHADGAAWLDGFLAGDAQVLLHDEGIRSLVDDWVGGMPDAAFDDALPLVRRSFSAFSAAERRMLGEQLRTGAAVRFDDDLDRERGLPAARRVALLIGLEVVA